MPRAYHFGLGTGLRTLQRPQVPLPKGAGARQETKCEKEAGGVNRWGGGSKAGRQRQGSPLKVRKSLFLEADKAASRQVSRRSRATSGDVLLASSKSPPHLTPGRKEAPPAPSTYQLAPGRLLRGLGLGPWRGSRRRRRERGSGAVAAGGGGTQEAQAAGGARGRGQGQAQAQAQAQAQGRGAARARAGAAAARQGPDAAKGPPEAPAQPGGGQHGGGRPLRTPAPRGPGRGGGGGLPAARLGPAQGALRRAGARATLRDGWRRALRQTLTLRAPDPTPPALKAQAPRAAPPLPAAECGL